MTHHTDGEERGDQFFQGMRAGTNHAVAWLHEMADKMNDPHAKKLIRVAALNLGNAARSKRYHKRMRQRAGN